jgi:hypothetical protein
MPLSLPEFPLLKVNTLNLNSRLSILLGRYTVVSNPLLNGGAADVSVGETCLEVLIARTNRMLQCETKRVSAREVFKKLVDELKLIPKGNEALVKQGASVLLGALIHRYFRILQEYADYNILSFWQYNPLNCSLFQAIREALQFDMKAEADVFRESDLKQLDVLTIINSLEAFRDAMLLEDGKKKPRFMNYPHFAQDEHFRVYLQNIIDHHIALDNKASKSDSLLGQFKAILFVQSLVNKLDLEHRQIEQGLDACRELLVKEYLDFSKTEPEIIEAHIASHIESNSIKSKILSLFNTPYIQDKFATYDPSSFFLAMKQCHYNKSGCTVFGGYTLLLQSDDINKKTKHCIYQALGLGIDASTLTGKEFLVGIQFLKQLMETDSAVDLDCRFFGGKVNLCTKISQIEESLVGGVQVAPPSLLKV